MNETKEYKIHDNKDRVVITSLEQAIAEIEKLRTWIAELDNKLSRKHGRDGKAFEKKEFTTLEEAKAEYVRLRNNWSSRVSKQRKAILEKQKEKTYLEILGLRRDDEDEYGISPKDERRYINCFKSGYIGAPVYRKFIKMMTGLSLMQMYVLQERTGYISTPMINMEEAKADEKRRFETGDYY